MTLLEARMRRGERIRASTFVHIADCQLPNAEWSLAIFEAARPQLSLLRVRDFINAARSVA